MRGIAAGYRQAVTRTIRSGASRHIRSDLSKYNHHECGAAP